MANDTETLTPETLLLALYARVAEFQERKFPEQSTMSKLHHLQREVTEIMAEPDDVMEWADVLILFCGAAQKWGFTLAEIVAAAHVKMDINERRKWGEPDSQGVRHHIEEGV